MARIPLAVGFFFALVGTAAWGCEPAQTEPVRLACHEIDDAAYTTGRSGQLYHILLDPNGRIEFNTLDGPGPWKAILEGGAVRLGFDELEVTDSRYYAELQGDAESPRTLNVDRLTGDVALWMPIVGSLFYECEVAERKF